MGNNGATETAVFVKNGSFTANHWTITNSGDIGIVAEDGTVNINNSIVAGHGVAAFNGANITDERPFCGGSDLGADEYVGGLSLAGLRLADAVQDGDLLTVSLTWPELTAVSHIELRYAPTRITDDN